MSKFENSVARSSERLITRQELARRWGVSTRTIDLRRKEGALPRAIILYGCERRTLRFRLSEIEAFEQTMREGDSK